MSVETGDEYLERSMRAPWTICWPSALFRRNALVRAGGHRSDDHPMADVPLLMRIALDWDIACLSETLAATRIHAESATLALGSYSQGAYVLPDQPRILDAHRQRFLDE